MKLSLNKSTKLMAGLCVAALMTVGSISASAESLAGKTITLIHNASPGGSTGLGAQVLANHWSKAIEGSPTMIVQSVPGGALTKGIHAAMNAKADGTTLAYVAWSGSTRILDEPPLAIEFEKLGLIGGIGGGSQMISVTTDFAGGVHSAEDFLKLEGFKFGGYSTKSMPSLAFAAAFDMLGLDWSFVSGFRGGGKIAAAHARGEIDVGMATSNYFQTQLEGGSVKDGVTLPLFYFGAPTADGKDLMKSEAFGDTAIPFSEFYRNATGKDPSGPEWDLIKFNGTSHEPVTWLVFAPEGTPADTLKNLRDAFASVAKDPTYLEETANVLGSAPNITYGQAIIDKVNNVQDTSDEMKDLIRSYIAKLQG